MIKRDLLKVVLIAVLVAVGVYLYRATPIEPQARAGTTLTTTWTATEFIDAQSVTEGGVPLETTIGVSRWHNRTYQGDRLVYEENWAADVPVTGDRSFVFHALGNQMAISLPSGYTQERLHSGWLFNAGGLELRGSDTNRVVRFTFTSTSPGLHGVDRIGRSNFRATGNSVSCVRGDNAQCIYATGAYGFNLTSGLGGGVNEHIDSFGAMIPIRWTVTGTLH